MTPTAAKPNRKAPPATPVSDLELRRFTVEEYHRLVEVGILHSGDPYELLDGWIVRKMPQSPPHVQATNRCSNLIQASISEAHVVRTANPITLEISESEPEPHVVVALGPFDRYETRHPLPKEIELLVEVSDATLNRDKRLKLPIYAQSKVAVYWIVNIPEQQIEVYTEPRGGKNPTYRRRTDYGPDAAVPVVIAGENRGSIAVRAVLPKNSK